MAWKSTGFSIDPLRPALAGVSREEIRKARWMTESKVEREARLKMALRDNLRKRKDQARAVPERDPGEPTGSER